MLILSIGNNIFAKKLIVTGLPEIVKKKKNKRTLYNPAVEIHQPTKIIIKRAGAPKYPNTNSEKAHSILWYITVYLEKRLKNIPRRRAVQLRC